MEIDRNGLEVLDRVECLRLLASARLGRVGVTSRALPQVLPVNFRFDGHRILIRTGRGTKLDAAILNAVVAFEVDEIDAESETGWSVLVTGVAHEVTDLSELAEVQAAPPPRWAPDGDSRVIALSLDLVSGRRIAAADPSRNGDGEP
ncbi:MAG TPA: pyridoxamine 5'-phosphate oxidase family protein [Acidimicrobiales bacterium]|nr:pyridoxamine 5'-phosphate oxidase family protein [Acidimicrobiales bacterium]